MSAHRLRFTLCGGFSCQDGDGKELGFANRKVAELAAALASNVGVERDRGAIASMVWPESGPEAGLASLRQALSTLRKDLGSHGVDPDAVLFADRTSLGFRFPAVCSDVGEFVRLTEDQTENTRLERLRRAVGLLQGPFLPDMSHDWVEPIRTTLSYRHTESLLELVESLVESGQFAEAAELAARSALSDIDSEPKVQLAVKVLTRTGQAAEALKLYRRFERRLRESLGVVPSESTVAAAREARRQATATKEAPASNLPQTLPTLFGRDEELGSILGKVAQGARLVTLQGPGGVGKTRLALEVGAALSERVAGAAWFVDLSSIVDPNETVGQILDALGLDVDQRDVETLSGRLRGHRSLLILDNLEQMGPGIGAVVGQIVDSCPQTTFMATSRNSLGWPGEVVVKLEPFKVAASGQDLHVQPGVQLFVDRARATNPSFALDDVGKVASLVDKLEGLPLAICLAAAQVETHTVQEIQYELEQRFELLQTKERGWPPRHRRLWACIDWSYQMVPETHALLRRLAVFRGGWTPTLAELVLPGEPVRSQLMALARSTLIAEQSRRASVRFDMVESVREFVVSTMPPDLVADADRAHAHAVHAWLMSDRVRLQKLDGDYNPTRTEEYENLRKAFEWHMAHDPETALDFINGLGYYWWSRDMFRDGLAWASRAVSAVKPRPLLELSMAHRVKATMLVGLSEYRAAYEAGLVGLQLMPDDADPVQQARFHNTMGNTATHFDPATAVHHFQTGVDLATKGGDPVLTRNLRANAAFARLMSGHLDEAETELKSVIDAMDPAENADWYGQFVHNYGLIAKARGDWEEADRRFMRAREAVSHLSVSPATRNWLTDASLVALKLGDTHRALALAKESAAGVRLSRGREAHVDVMEVMADYCEAVGDFSEAVALLSAAERTGVASQRSASETSETRAEKLSRLKGQLPRHEFAGAVQRYKGLDAVDVLQEVELYGDS